MSLPLPSDTANPAPVAIPPDASKAPAPRIPLKAQLSFLRQRIILTVRWWFRLEIDDIKERANQAQIQNLLDLNQKQLDTIKSLSTVLAHQGARLKFYEKNVPRMRELRAKFDREQAKLGQSVNSVQEDLENGILHLPTNGHPPHP